MQDLKNIFKTLKELWSHPKLKGTVQLIFWFLFFVVVALIFRSASTNNVSSKKVEEVQKDTAKDTITDEKVAVLSYEYEYNYTDNYGNNAHITGTNYKNKNIFYQDNVKYYFVNNKYYNALDNSIVDYPYNLIEWQYSNVKNIMDSQKYSNTTRYKNGLINYEYLIDLDNYNNYYGQNYQNDIIMDIVYDGSVIKSVNINYTFATVEIIYTKINEIEDIEINIQE